MLNKGSLNNSMSAQPLNTGTLGRNIQGRAVKTVSLFTGCGGSDKGLIDAGCEILMANDILAYAKEVYEANLPETDFKTDSIDQIKAFPSADVEVFS